MPITNSLEQIQQDGRSVITTAKTRLNNTVQYVYDTAIRPVTPRRPRHYNDIPVRDVKLFDRAPDRPDYEQPLVDRIKATVTPGDSVGIVGGGRGVSAVYAARAGGDVTVYEAAAEQVSVITDTIQRTGVDSDVAVKHACVGPPVAVWGDPAADSRIAPSNIPAFDVLVLDCEGSELDIIPEIDAESVIVETHGWLGSPASAVTASLRRQCYEVVDECVDSPAHGNKIVSAIRT